MKDWTKQVGVFFEHDISLGDFSYLIIFGYHVNGGWICIPNHSWGCEASYLSPAIDFNTQRLIKAGATPNVATQIATYIDKWLINNQEQVEKVYTESQKYFLNYLSKL